MYSKASRGVMRLRDALEGCAIGHQPIPSVTVNYPPLVQYNDTATVFHGAQPVRDHQNGLVAGQGGHKFNVFNKVGALASQRCKICKSLILYVCQFHGRLFFSVVVASGGVSAPRAHLRHARQRKRIQLGISYAVILKPFGVL